MEYAVGTFGPVVGLVIALVLIAGKLPPVWSLLIGAAVGGILGGGDFVQVGSAMLRGSVDMLPSACCILASGILAGALIRTGAAERIARTVLNRLGSRWAAAAVAASVMLLTAAGVFVDIAVITAAPIALAIGRKTGHSSASILLAMIGGGKAGNVISPNPNTIAAAKAFSLDLTSVMAVNLIPAMLALAMTVILASRFEKGRAEPGTVSFSGGEVDLPSFVRAASGPVTVFLLLALRPAAGIALDPVLVLPVGGLICILVTGNGKRAGGIILFGLREVCGVALLLLTTGTIAGVIQASSLQRDMILALEVLHVPAYLLAPLSGILMGGAAASTTAGTAIAAKTFGPALLQAGVPALCAAAMIHTGATVLDSLPHGSFFHATAGCAELDLKQRLKLLPGEAIIGLTSTAAAVICTFLM